MVLIKILLATASFPFLNAIIVDSYYTPSQNKEQVHTFQSIRPPSPNRPQENTDKETYHSKEAVSEPYAKPLYKYGYSVLDPYTLDVKSHWEHRDGDFVKGAYNMLEADGSMRIVEYVSDKDTGFRAIVKKIPNYLKTERPLETFPLSKSNNFPEQFFSPPKPEPPAPAPYQHLRDKGHLANYHENAVPARDKGHLVQNYNENIIPRDKGHLVQNYNENVIPRDKGHFLQNYNENTIPRDKGHLQNYHDYVVPHEKGQLQNYNENALPRDKGYSQNYHEKNHLQNYHQNPIREFDDRPLNENYIQRENYYKQYQKKVRKQPVNMYRHVINTG